MFQCPIDYYTENLIFNQDKSVWALFELVGYDYDLLSDEGKAHVFQRLMLFLSNIDSEAQVMMIPVSQDLDGKDIAQSRVDDCRRMAQQVYDRQSKRLALRPIDSPTTQWLLRRTTYRGLKQDAALLRRCGALGWKPVARDLELAGERYLRPRSRELVNLFSGVITKRDRRLEIAHGGVGEKDRRGTKALSGFKLLCGTAPHRSI